MRYPKLTIEELCQLITDGTHYSPPDIGNGIPFLTVKDMSEKGLDFVNSSKISMEEYQRALVGNSAPQVGDVLFSKDGTVGKVHVVNEAQNFAVLSSIAILRPNPSLLDADYLGFALKIPQVLEQAFRKKTGSALRRIILKDLKGVEIPLPPLGEQRRIAAVLGRADALRAQRRAALAQLDTLLQSTFLHLFGDPVTNPMGWEKATIGDICRVKGGKRLPKGETYSDSPTAYRYIRIADINNGVIDVDSLNYLHPKTYQKISRYIVNEGDVIISIAGTIGITVPVTAELNGINLTENAAKLVAKKPHVYLPSYLAFYLQTNAAQNQIQSQTGTVTISKLALFRIEKVEILLPPIELQQKFYLMAQKIKYQQKLLTEHLTQLDTLFHSLQQRAFAGQL
ncbi:MAG: restriction endonuclease subunit S [Chloroflexi bacterium]|nr:restriction endonuclease subunit S [Chloroflexota bacterium]